MNVSTYNALLKQYNLAWKTVTDLRAHVQDADAYLGSYGVKRKANELQLRIDPNAHIEAARWPSAEEILRAVAAIKELGEQVVSAYNHLSLTDRYLVAMPHLHEQVIADSVSQRLFAFPTV